MTELSINLEKQVQYEKKSNIVHAFIKETLDGIFGETLKINKLSEYIILKFTNIILSVLEGTLCSVDSSLLEELIH